MKKRMISLAGLSLLALLVSCDPGERKYDPMTIDINAEVNQFKILSEVNYKWRAKGLELLENIKKRQNSNLPIDSKQIATIHQKGIVQYTQIRQQFWDVIEKAVRVGDAPEKVRFTLNNPTSYDEKNDVYTVNPNDEMGRKLIKIAKMSYAAGLILCDNYGSLISNIYKQGQLRRLADLDDEATKDALDDVVDSYLKVKNRLRLDAGYELYTKVKAIEEKNKENPLIKDDKDNQYLNEVIEGSMIYNHRKNMTKEDKINAYLGERIYDRRMGFRDKLVNGKNEVMNSISKVFGNTLGLIEKRKGKMLEYVEQGEGVGQKWVNQISEEMKALDILFEKTPFRTTDKFIPGHWGHVAIWSGNEKELKQIGLWNDNGGQDWLDKTYEEARVIRNYSGLPYKLAISTGHQIIEALRPGVQINTVHHFMNIDDFAVIRLKDAEYRNEIKINNPGMENDEAEADYERRVDELVKDSKVEMLKNAFNQVGKEYDFNFDVETAKKIVCSELAYVTYSDSTYFPWGTTETLNRKTISPDEVAVAGISSNENNLFEPVILFHAAVRIPDENIKSVYDKLLESENKNRYVEVEEELGNDFVSARKVSRKEYE